MTMSLLSTVLLYYVPHLVLYVFVCTAFIGRLLIVLEKGPAEITRGAFAIFYVTGEVLPYAIFFLLWIFATPLIAL